MTNRKTSFWPRVVFSNQIHSDRFRIHLISNPADAAASVCDVTFCKHCRDLTRMPEKMHFTQESSKPQTLLEITSVRNLPEKYNTCSIYGLLLDGKIKEIELFYNDYSRYFILLSNCPKGYNSFKNSRSDKKFTKDPQDLPIIHSSTKYYITPSDFVYFQLIMTAHKRSIPVVIHISDMQRVLYWFTCQKMYTKSCLNVIILIKEANSYCTKYITRDNVPYLITKYNLTDILGVKFQAGYFSCQLLVEIKDHSSSSSKC